MLLDFKFVLLALAVLESCIGTRSHFTTAPSELDDATFDSAIDGVCMCARARACVCVCVCVCGPHH